MKFSYRGSKFDSFFDKIPNSIINFLSIISVLGSFASPVIGYLKIKRNIKAGKVEGTYDFLLWIICVTFIFLCLLLVYRIVKYKQLVQGARKITCENYYNFLHDFRNTYFDILNHYKMDQLNVPLLTTDLQNFLKKSLDYLCEIFSEFTRQKVSACIKYIDGSTERIDIETATVRTLVRSTNTHVNRNSNDKNIKGAIKIKDNTDFYDILSSGSKNKKPYFYQRNLVKYKKALRANGLHYDNSTQNWEEYYRSTIVVPIRIANERLFFNSQSKSYNVIGFLCVDSMSVNAFLENQENYNILLLKSFAAEIYIILNQYKYYLEKITTDRR